MFVDYAVTKHAVGYPANVLAQHYGEHMPHVLLSTDADNGNIVGVGDWDHMDVFKQTTPTAIEGKVVAQNVDGTYLVLITKADNAAFVYQKPLNAIESPKALTQESAMYNKSGDVVRTYMLHALDRIAVSAEGFSGDVAVGKTVSGVTDKKLTISAGA